MRSKIKYLSKEKQSELELWIKNNIKINKILILNKIKGRISQIEYANTTRHCCNQYSNIKNSIVFYLNDNLKGKGKSPGINFQFIIFIKPKYKHQIKHNEHILNN